MKESDEDRVLRQRAENKLKNLLESGIRKPAEGLKKKNIEELNILKKFIRSYAQSEKSYLSIENVKDDKWVKVKNVFNPDLKFENLPMGHSGGVKN